MIVKGIFSVKCNNCGVQHNYPAIEANFDLTSINERSLGRENCYSWGDEIKCNCGQDIDFNYDVWEYPQKTLSEAKVKINGGS